MPAGRRASEQVSAAVADAHRREWAFVLAATVRVARDIDLAEECVQEAYAQALTTWTWSGIPASPGAWLTTTARRRALDAIRRQATLARKLPLLIEPGAEPRSRRRRRARPGAAFPDDRLRLIFTCCHPALAPAAQVALTLRLVCGLTTAEVAHAFLVSEPTMAARLTRAKKKIAAARIPYRVPPPDELPARIGAVLTVVHLLFTTGHTAPTGGSLVRADLVERGLDVARMLHDLLPDDADVDRPARAAAADRQPPRHPDGRGRQPGAARRPGPQPLGSRRHHRGLRARQASAHAVRAPGRFPLEAAIAAVHAEAPTWEATDWPQIVGLYDALLARWPSPVVALNRAVAVSFAAGPEAGLAELDRLGSLEPAGELRLPAGRPGRCAAPARARRAGPRSPIRKP